MNSDLLNNIDNIHTTILGEERIKKNLLIDGNVIDYIKKILLNKSVVIYHKGKNYYCELNNIIITINASNYCVITAKKR